MCSRAALSKGLRTRTAYIILLDFDALAFPSLSRAEEGEQQFQLLVRPVTLVAFACRNWKTPKTFDTRSKSPAHLHRLRTRSGALLDTPPKASRQAAGSHLCDQGCWLNIFGLKCFAFTSDFEKRGNFSPFSSCSMSESSQRRRCCCSSSSHGVFPHLDCKEKKVKPFALKVVHMVLYQILMITIHMSSLLHCIYSVYL